MVSFLIVLHVIVSIVLIGSVLLQSSKGGGLGGMFGGGGASVLGARGAATFLAKITMYAAIGFGITTMSIALLSTKSNQTQKSMVQQVIENEEAAPSDILPIAPGNADQTADQQENDSEPVPAPIE